MLDAIVDRKLTESRLAQAGPFLTICSVGWLAYAVYALATGRHGTSVLCGVEALIACGCRLLLQGPKRELVVRVYLVLAATGIFVESMTSGLGLSSSPFFLSCVVLAAVQLLGPQSALRWTSFAVVGLVLIHFVIRPEDVPLWRQPTQQDRFVAQIVLSLIVLCLALLMERFVRHHTDSMQAVSDLLRLRTKELGELVSLDPLTGLANRHGLDLKIEDAIAQANENGTEIGVLVVDLDGFKQINDTMGHASGDIVLRVVAERLREAVEEPDSIVRVGGDEFVVIVERPVNELEVMLAAGRIVRSIGRPYSLDGVQLDLGASVGVAIYPKHSESVDELLSFADAAMYDAKVRQLGVQVYESRLTDELQRRRTINEKLKSALPNDEFTLFYQPQAEIESGNITGVEALIRWRHGTDCIMPAKFVPQLESSRFIVDVGRWVLQEACRQSRLWQQQGIDMRMSVNVSAIQFQQKSFIDDVFEALESNGLSPGNLDIELTESVLIENQERAISKVDVLRESGVSISVDDFGTGYSSLAYLRALPINRLKIDREFIKDIPEQDDGTIAAAIISLAHNLGMSVIAEGVSTGAQRSFLQEHGCGEFQGYLFSKPLELPSCERFLAMYFPNSLLPGGLPEADNEDVLRQVAVRVNE